MDDLDKPGTTPNSAAPAATVRAAPAVYENTALFYPLRLTLGSGGAAVELTKPDMVVGRHSSADLRLPLPDISRRHCRFVFSNGQWQVFDLQSTNGVFVNDQRVEQSNLRHQDHLQIGSYIFEVELSSAPPQRRAS